MSRASDRHEAQRWLDTAAGDLGAARALREARFHAHACFAAQQCAEKAAKALWYLIGADPWGHSIQALIEDFPLRDRLDNVEALIERAAALDRFYIPTRYPNGLPDLTPGETYFPADSARAINLAGEPPGDLPELDQCVFAPRCGVCRVATAHLKPLATIDGFWYVEGWAEGWEKPPVGQGHSYRLRGSMLAERVAI